MVFCWTYECDGCHTRSESCVGICRSTTRPHGSRVARKDTRDCRLYQRRTSRYEWDQPYGSLDDTNSEFVDAWLKNDLPSLVLLATYLRRNPAHASKVSDGIRIRRIDSGAIGPARLDPEHYQTPML